MQKGTAFKARHVDNEQAGLPGRRSGSEGRGGMRQSVGGNRQGKALKDRTLLLGNIFPWQWGNYHLIWKRNTVPWPSGVAPDIRPQSTLWGLPRAWPRSPSEPFLGVPGISPCNFAYTTPNNRLLVLPVAPCWSHMKGAC